MWINKSAKQEGIFLFLWGKIRRKKIIFSCCFWINYDLTTQIFEEKHFCFHFIYFNLFIEVKKKSVFLLLPQVLIGLGQILGMRRRAFTNKIIFSLSHFSNKSGRLFKFNNFNFAPETIHILCKFWRQS